MDIIVSVKDCQNTQDLPADSFLPEFHSDLDIHLPCFEAPDDWMMESPEFVQGGDSPTFSSGASDYSLPGESMDDIPEMSEFSCVRFSDILLPGARESEVGTSKGIESAPAFDNLEVDRILNDLNDIDLPDFYRQKSTDKTITCGKKAEKAEILPGKSESVSISRPVESLAITADSNLDPHDSDDSQTEPHEPNTSYRERLRKRSRKESTAFNTELDRPALKMVKVSHKDQFEERGVRSLRSRRDDPALSAMEDEVQRETDKSRKAAIQAKLNREKKKAYTRHLEEERERLKAENKVLKVGYQKLEKSQKSLKREVDYLRGVLLNQSALAGLLKNIGNTAGINLSSSFIPRADVETTQIADKEDSMSSVMSPSEQLDHDYFGKPRKLAQVPVSRGKQGPNGQQVTAMEKGVCLHVHNNENVSLEFCSSCAKRAQESFKSCLSDYSEN